MLLMRHAGWSLVVLAVAAGCGDKSSSTSSKKDDSSESDSPKKKSSSSSSSSTASSKPSSAPSAQPPPGPIDGYVRFTSPEGKFEVMLPALPPPVIKTPVEVKGKQVIMHTFAVEQGNAGYAVSYGDVEGQLVDLKVFLNDSVTGAFKGMGAKLDGTKDIKMGDLQGLEGSGSHPELAAIRVRIFASVSPNTVRQYNLMAAGQPDERATAFFDSFKITK
jgi:hypothetical protein